MLRLITVMPDTDLQTALDPPVKFYAISDGV
jgi:hypothetical protein